MGICPYGMCHFGWEGFQTFGNQQNLSNQKRSELNLRATEFIIIHFTDNGQGIPKDIVGKIKLVVGIAQQIVFTGGQLLELVYVRINDRTDS